MIVRCCVTNIDEWRETPHGCSWQQALTLIQPIERKRIEKYLSSVNAKRTLMGRLLARSMVSQDLALPNWKINLSRTSTGKPYLKNLRAQPVTRRRTVKNALTSINGNDNSIPFRYDFNVSHDGSWVAASSLYYKSVCGLVKEPLVAVGIDVVKYDLRRKNKNFESLFASLQDEFTEEECRQIEDTNIYYKSEGKNKKIKPGPLENSRIEFIKLKKLYRRWAVKEAYTKAMGVGLEFGFHRIECIGSSADTGQPRILVDGEQVQDWHFKSFDIDRLHHVVLCFSCGGASEIQRLQFIDQTVTHVGGAKLISELQRNNNKKHLRFGLDKSETKAGSKAALDIELCRKSITPPAHFGHHNNCSVCRYGKKIISKLFSM